MAPVYSYIRFSAKAQERGDSLRRQSSGADDFVERGKHTLVNLTLRDLGVSAFRGKNRDKHKGALGKFLEAIKEGKIEKGSILLVENLDRLSREGVNEAFLLFNEILRAGVLIAVLTPVERIYDKKSLNDIGSLLEPLIAFQLAHEESKKKSQRLKAHWDNRRKQIDQQPLTKKCPSWVEWKEINKGKGLTYGAFVLNEEKAQAIRYIFRRTIDGIGQKQILNELAEKFPPMGRSGKWNSSFISKVLTDPATYGEFQLHELTEEGERVPTGKPIKDYYPAAITEDTFHRARQASKQRYKNKGGPSSGFVNVLSGLVYNARDKSIMHIQTTRGYKTKKGQPKPIPYTQRRFVSYASLTKTKGACKKTYAVEQVERHVLNKLQHITLDMLEPSNQEGKVQKAKQELEVVKKRIEDLAKALEDFSNPLPQIIEAMKTLQTKQTKLTEIVQASLYSAPVSDLMTEFRNGMIFENSPDKRKKLRGMIQQIIKRVDLLIWEINPRRVGAVVQVTFNNGQQFNGILTIKHFIGFNFDLCLENATKKELKDLEKRAEEWRVKYE